LETESKRPEFLTLFFPFYRKEKKKKKKKIDAECSDTTTRTIAVRGMCPCFAGPAALPMNLT